MRPIDADSVFGYLVEEGQDHASKYGFRLGDTIKFSPSQVAEIIEKMPTIAEPRWIPVVERLPLKPGFYLVTVGAPYKPVRVYEYNPCEGYENENLWKGEDGAYVFNWFVEAWQNHPEPWKGEADG